MPLEPVGDPLLTLQALQKAIPDPEAERLRLHEKLAGELGQARRRALESVLQRLDGLRRPLQTTLGLDDAIRRALSHSFAIRIESYNPAVEQTRVVEAQAAFDALFFANVTRDKSERPSGSPQLTGTTSNSLGMVAGIRKLLPTGLQVTTQYSMTRTSSDSLLSGNSFLNSAHAGMEKPSRTIASNTATPISDHFDTAALGN